MIVGLSVSCSIARDAELMEQLTYHSRDDALEFKTPEQFRLRFLRRRQKAGFRGCQLREDFTELTELNQACIRVLFKIAFSQRTEPHELRIVLSKKSKLAETGFITSRATRRNSSSTFLICSVSSIRQPTLWRIIKRAS
jgi:hypothetical protein